MPYPQVITRRPLDATGTGMPGSAVTSMRAELSTFGWYFPEHSDEYAQAV
ncbi:hypothetical protein ACWGJT_13900 [Streptomyces xantholiticus]